MIIDKISNASLYYCLGPGIKSALTYLASQDFSQLQQGRYDIADGCYAIIQDYETVPKEEMRWEAHRKYIDVQYIASGNELIGHTDITKLSVVEAYNLEKDITWLEGKGDFASMTTGSFMILFPHDAHMPGVCHNNVNSVRKVVVKVSV